MEKETGAKLDVRRRLQFKPVNRIERLKFLLLEYHFFRDTEEGSALPLSLPWFLSPLSFILHIIKSHALVLLRLPCFFVKLETKIVGLFAIQTDYESLVVASLAVAKEYRRLGIGTCVLGYIERIAKHMNKRWLETLVLRKNIPAQRLYAGYGFKFTQSGKTHFIMRKETCIEW